MKVKGIKNNLRNWIENCLNECNPLSIASVAAGFVMLSFLSLLLLMLFATCKGVGTGHQPKGTASGGADSVGIVNYRRPELPEMMTDPEQRALFYVNHYWDGYSTADTAFVSSDETEQLYADFIDALQYVDAANIRTALQAMMQHVEADSTAYARFCSLSEKYLYNPNSPMRNENYYIPVLEQMLASTRLTDLDKLRPADRLKQALKNRPGMKAPDFSYVTPKGKAGRLCQLKAEYTLLFFYDPDCTSCQEFERVLSEMPFFLELQKKGIVRVLAIYPDDDETEWLLKSSQMPDGWIVGWNKKGDIRSKTLYEIRATPTLFLLDKHKKVILKDATLEQIVGYLSGRQ